MFFHHMFFLGGKLVVYIAQQHIFRKTFSLIKYFMLFIFHLITLHANFQISFSILDKTFYIIHGNACFIYHFLITFLFYEKKLNGDSLFFIQFFNTIFQFGKYCFFTVFIIKMLIIP